MSMEFDGVILDLNRTCRNCIHQKVCIAKINIMNIAKQTGESVGFGNAEEIIDNFANICESFMASEKVDC